MNLEEGVESLKGIGKKTAESLRKGGIKTVRDLFYYLPRSYENFQNLTKIANLKPGKVVIKGQIENLNTHYGRSRRLAVTEGVIKDDTASVRVVWFNQSYRAKQFQKGKTYLFSGNFELKYGRLQLTSPSATLYEEESDGLKNAIRPEKENLGFQPIYSAKLAIKPDQFKKFIKTAKPEIARVPDLLPKASNLKPNLRSESLLKVHFPKDQKEADEGRKYLAYEEIFELILAARLNREENQKLKSEKLPFKAKNTKEIISTLPFTLTPGQKRATWDILQDLEKPVPMNRLLQGDVGSGKTVVAAIAAYQAIKAGAQVALLAPTSILASQHVESLDTLLKPLGVKTALLIGSTKNKAELKKHIKSGDVNLVVGTHAIITDDTEFNNLAFCIIDEQHRFGVAQRQKLLLKSKDGLAPHLLSMTATPIPRSLELTIFGDLEVSTIPEPPKGRMPIKTKIIREMDQTEFLYPKVKEEIKNGRQVYWICKAIEDNPKEETVSVKKQAEKLAKIFPKSKIDFLHGRMKPAEKDEKMLKFQSGKIDILVSTTVVEVGVNVPNATLMVIMDAEGFGLAQLHQLRGRVGRGEHQSFCFLVKSGEEPPSRRLRELEKSTSGFYLAEVDLKIRGPGEIYGSLQSGVLDLRIATFSDTALIRAASKQVNEFMKNDSLENYPELAHTIKKYQQLTTLN
ncbi:MAG: ATP-dependent DNA helicase RecG [Candidatus Saccharibacteria bacterium]|nr:ATP-dependent DNA helicase RecG [Candidatus Saccharibacteria bacterium]